MIFIFKKPKIVLDCFTANSNAMQNKIDHAHKFIPDWWKTAPKNINHDFYSTSTLKRCQGLIDTYRQGLMIPLWSDIAFKIQDGSYQWQYADGISEATHHDTKQFDFYVNPKDYGHIKLNSPWIFKSKDNIKFYWTKPFWNYKPNNPYFIIDGVIDFKYNPSTHINMFLNLTMNHSFIINAGLPIIHAMPLSDKEIVIKTHLVSNEFMTQNQKSAYTFINKYKNSKKSIIKEEKESKCPFSFLRSNK
jgi:hypothetical protein